MNKLTILSYYFCFILVHQVTCKLNFQIRNFELCNKTQGEFRLLGNLSALNNVLSVNVEWDVKRQLDDKIGLNLLVESKVTKNLYVEVFPIHDKSVCHAAHTYLGELWFNLERKVGIPVGVCPMPSRNYIVKNHQVDFNTMKLRSFPYGTLRVTIRVEDNDNRANALTCCVLEIENVRK